MPRFLNGLGDVWFALALIVALTLYSCGVSRAHATTTSRRNSLGTLSYQDNPNQYLMGYVSRADIAESDKRQVIVLEVRPTNTYAMFSQQVQFCAATLDREVGKQLLDAVSTRAVVVFTFSRFRHSMDCNDLYRVDVVKEK